MKIDHVPSISMCLIDSNYSVWYKGYGYSKILTLQRPTKDTAYLIASISKTVAATALMQLYDEGLFDLDDDVNDYLDFNVRNPNYPDTPVTFRMLLSHHSSLAGKDIPLEYIFYCYIKNTKNYPYPMIKEIITPNGSFYKENIWNSYEPGSNIDYSGIGFILIEHLIEAISKQKFSDFCKQNIFNPLKMKNTSFVIKDFKRSQLATQYYDILRIFIRLPFIDMPYAMGGLRTSIDDFSHFVIAHMNGGVWNDVRILNESTVSLMHTIQYQNHSNERMRYGLGFRIFYGNWSSTFQPYGHAGNRYGSTSYMGINKSNDKAVIFFINKAFDFSKMVDLLAYFRIMQLLYSWDLNSQ
jgi:CubicO group peptidase (beta-lactamase class C family)